MTFRTIAAATLFIVVTLMANSATAQPSPVPVPFTTVSVQNLPPAAIAHRTSLDPAKATNAYLSRVSGPARARSDAYFEGKYWLMLADSGYSLVVAAILLWLGISAGMRNLAQRITRSRFWQVSIYVVQFVVVTTILTFPLSLYEDFIREHAYGLSNQNFMQWFGDFGKGFGVGLAGAVIVLSIIYSVIRATPQRWWAWGTLVAVIFFAVSALIAPVFISPLFNDYKPLREGPVKIQILRLAAANGVPTENVVEFNASKQSKRISANVSGFLGTTRISMNDNLLNRCSPAEIEAVLGHEMGHYVLNHAALLITWFGLVILAAFLFLNWAFKGLVNIFGGNWDVRSIDDPAGLPALAALLSVFMLAATPVTNTITRTAEAQADIFGLNAARQPDGFATVALKLSEYRKLDPTPLEEFIFYDHPSGRTRIFTAMRWKAAHLNDPDIQAGPVSPQ